MIPISLSISGFLSYRDPVELDFTDFKLACIAGQNGAGKSSLLDAITWALYGKARKSDDSIINAQSTAARVCLQFEYEGNVYRVERAKAKDKTTLLEFGILLREDDRPPTWRPLTEHTVSKTEERIRQTLRMDYDTFINASFFLQGKADLFTQQRPGDRKAILSSILGLEIWEHYRSDAAERRKKVEGEIRGLDGRLQEINTELGEEGQRRTLLKDLNDTLQTLEAQRQVQEIVVQSARQAAANIQEQERWLESRRRQLEAAERRLAEDQMRLQNRRQEHEQHTQTLANAGKIEAAYAAWQSARRDLEQHEESARRYHDGEKQREAPRLAIEARRASLRQEQAGLEERRTKIEAGLAESAELQAGINADEAALKAAEERLEGRGALENQYQENTQHQAQLKSANERLRQDMKELEDRIIMLEANAGAECPMCGQPLPAADRLALIERLKNDGKALGDRYREHQEELTGLGEQIAGITSQIAALKPVEAELRLHAARLAGKRSRWDGLDGERLEWEAAGAPRLEAVRSLLETESFEPEARLRLAEIDAALLQIGYDRRAHDDARQAEAAGRDSEAQQRLLEAARAASAPLQREIEELEKQLEVAEKDTAAQRFEYDEAATVLSAAKQAAPDLQTAEDLLYRLVEQANETRTRLGMAQQKVAVLEDLKERVAQLERDREDYARLVQQYKKLERAFGKDGVPALLIEQALPEIETHANEVLDRLSDGSMSVHFVTQSAFKDPKRTDLRETLDIQINDGLSTREYELFSGGEAFRVNFAIRLALSEMLAKRAGARLQTLVIDEGFGSQDQFGRQRLMEAINLVRPDFEKILVITHIEELKDAFPTRIEVEKTAAGSVVRMI